MTRKKKEVEAETEVHEPTPPLFLTREEMLEMQLWQVTGQLADANIKLKAMEKDAYITQIDPQGKLAVMLTEIRSNSNLFSEAKGKLAELKAKVEQRLGISALADYAYDEVTGILQKADQ